MPAFLSAPCAPTIRNSDDDCFGLERYRCCGRLHPRSASRGSVSLVAWSLGGPRAGGYAARIPRRLRSWCAGAGIQPHDADGASCAVPANGAAMNTQSRDRIHGELGSPGRMRRSIRSGDERRVWSKMVESDPVGATWGPGVRRAPQTTTWGWNAKSCRRATPTLMVAGVHDKQVNPNAVRELYADLGS